MSAVYLDTNALVMLIERRDPAIRSFLTRVNAAGRLLVTSELTLAELLVKPIELGDVDLVQTYESLLFTSGIIRTHPVSLEILRKSAELRADLGGNLPDSIHVATAVALNCPSILSSDRRLKVPDGLTRVPIEDLQGQ